jgi:hypothetical protein
VHIPGAGFIVSRPRRGIDNAEVDLQADLAPQIDQRLGDTHRFGLILVGRQLDGNRLAGEGAFRPLTDAVAAGVDQPHFIEQCVGRGSVEGQ